jgi:hypothetical protein
LTIGIFGDAAIGGVFERRARECEQRKKDFAFAIGENLGKTTCVKGESY